MRTSYICTIHAQSRAHFTMDDMHTSGLQSPDSEGNLKMQTTYLARDNRLETLVHFQNDYFLLRD